MHLHAVAAFAATILPQSAPPLKVLFLGDQGHHQPRLRHAELAPALAKEGIELEYTEDLGRLSVAGLADKDVLLVYANIDELGAERGRTLVSWIRDGKGLAAIHCASFCFRDSDEYVRLVGAQFESHGWERFTTDLVGAAHEGFRGFLPFEGFDETYVHARHGTDREIIEVRRDGAREEPWTWTRREGSGRNAGIPPVFTPCMMSCVRSLRSVPVTRFGSLPGPHKRTVSCCSAVVSSLMRR